MQELEQYLLQLLVCPSSFIFAVIHLKSDDTSAADCETTVSQSVLSAVTNDTVINIADTKVIIFQSKVDLKSLIGHASREITPGKEKKISNKVLIFHATIILDKMIL